MQNLHYQYIFSTTHPKKKKIHGLTLTLILLILMENQELLQMHKPKVQCKEASGEVDWWPRHTDYHLRRAPPTLYLPIFHFGPKPRFQPSNKKAQDEHLRSPRRWIPTYTRNPGTLTSYGPNGPRLNQCFYGLSSRISPRRKGLTRVASRCCANDDSQSLEQ